jgi:hypothetical protein
MISHQLKCSYVSDATNSGGASLENQGGGGGQTVQKIVDNKHQTTVPILLFLLWTFAFHGLPWSLLSSTTGYQVPMRLLRLTGKLASFTLSVGN